MNQNLTIFLTVLFTTLAWYNIANAVYCYKRFVAHTYKNLLKGYVLYSRIVIITSQIIGCVGIMLAGLAYVIRAIVKDVKQQKVNSKEAVLKDAKVERIETKPLPKKSESSTETKPVEKWI